MDIYLTDLETNDRIRFPMLPKKIKLRIANQFYNYNIINIGEVRIPSGQELDAFNWDSMFPGKARQSDPYIREWKDPKELYKWISSRKAKKGENKKLRLLITETPINCDVLLNDFDGEFSGGFGDYTYQINLIQAKDVKIYVSGTRGPANSSSYTAATVQNKPQGTERPSPPPSKTYTVVRGDSLWSIAEKMMGGGSRYVELYEANKSIIDTQSKQNDGEKYSVYAGQILTIPA